MSYWVVADYSPFGTWRDPPIIVQEFKAQWSAWAWIKAWWFAKRHVYAHPYAQAYILNHPPPPIGDSRCLA